MKVSCPSCDAKYTIADDKVLGKKIKVRCKTCSTQILVDGTVPHVADATDSEGDAANPAPDSIESDAWTVNLSESEERTMTTQEIVESAIRDELGNDVFVWKEGMSDWVLVTDVPELKAAIESAKKSTPSSRPSPAFSKSAVAGKTPSTTKAAARTSSAKKVVDHKLAAATEKQSGSVKPPAAEQTGEKRGPIAAAPGSALAKKMASARSASTAPKAEPVPEQPKEFKSEPAPKAATRLATKRPHSTHDLFAAVDQAGSEIDVDTSDVQQPDHSKATGARNENSVLFSLDALKSGLTGGTKPAAQQSSTGPRKKAPGPPVKRIEDLMSFDATAPMLGGMGGGGLLLSGNDALLTAPAPPPPKPEPKPKPVAATSGADAAIYAPPRRSKVGIIIGVIAGIAVVGTASAMLALKFGSNNASVLASADLSSKAPTSASAPLASALPSASAAASLLASAAGPPDAAAPSAVASAPVAPTNTGKVGVGSAVAKAASESKEKEKTKESKPSEASFAAASGGFSKDAAVAALSVAASQATVCKRPEGPWGSGKALVTFAPSGRVTTANVTGSPFGGTPVGGCVANVFRRARIPAFSGDSVTVSKSFSISP